MSKLEDYERAQKKNKVFKAYQDKQISFEELKAQMEWIRAEEEAIEYREKYGNYTLTITVSCPKCLKDTQVILQNQLPNIIKYCPSCGFKNDEQAGRDSSATN